MRARWLLAPRGVIAMLLGRDTAKPNVERDSLAGVRFVILDPPCPSPGSGLLRSLNSPDYF